ncbi:Ohr subfamily peroxiredoxin [Hamadaea flava]|uniref:Organic hydroperoxide resistance protein n=1 Tax=Hamadaea flava TaxID=1742688 RepID=A0ABV8LRE2_9ACTN|nr:organic hydroperoxide resistance protein [Hamadaea flava]MCP2328689.1 Ohr subfamily peroxiredoxin [Hamadaea flava]
MSLYTAVATSAGRDTRAVTSDGRLDVKLALQKEFGGDGDGTNPEQLFAAGYAACFISALQAVARRRRIDASGSAATAEVGLHGEEDGSFRLSVVLRIELPDHLAGDPGRELVEAAHQVCPYSNATRGNIPVELVIE